MKKQYFLALVASVVCGMSAQAQIQAPLQTVPMTQIQQPTQSNLKANTSSSLLRATDTRLLPDSVYSGNSAGGYDKTYYKYTEEGLVSEQVSQQWMWTSDGGGDYFFFYYKWEYDEHGNQTRYTYDNRYNGTTGGTTYVNTYDEQERLSSRYSVTENGSHSIANYEYDGNNYTITTRDSSFNADGTLSDISYYKYEYHFDDAGNQIASITYGISGWEDEEAPIWYPQTVNEYTCEPNGFILNGRTTQYDEVGNVTYEFYYENEFLDESGKNFIQRNDWISFGNTDVSKYEVEGENPEIEYRSTQNVDGTWTEREIRQIRFYPGPLTANETIKDSAEPTFKAYATDGSLVITTAEARAVQVYSIAGACHYNATVNGYATISNLPAGIYVIASEGETLKVSVR